MSDERQYAAVEVVGVAAGMNQAGWEGAIKDNECTMLYNMGTTLDGEWKKRQGYDLLKQFVVTTGGEVAKLHWHTDESTDQADATTWCETGDEITAASSGALNVTSIYRGVTDPVLDGETVGALYTNDELGAIGIKSSFNLNANAGKMTFWFKTVATSGEGSPTSFSSDVKPPDSSVWLFYAGVNFSVYVGPSGNIIWKYGGAAEKFINAGPYTYETWHKVDLRWDNVAAGTIYPLRYQIRIDGVLMGSNDTGPVTNTMDADVFFLNTSASGTDSPGMYLSDVPAENHGNYVTAGLNVRTYIALVCTWDAEGSVPVEPNITGIHNNSSQQRAIITAGATGKVFYSPSWTLATGTHSIANTRTSATECQGNIYIVDGTTTMFYLIGTATAVTSYTLPETAKWIEEYNGHLAIAGLGTSGAYSVRLSTLDDFVTSSAVSWPATNQVFKCRDVVRGIKAFDGQLIVGTRSTIESISGYQPHDFAKTIVATGASCASHWSMKEVPLMDGATSALVWAGYDGIYMLVAGTVSKVSWNIQPFWDTLSKTEIEESHAVDCRSRGEYMLAVSDGLIAENNYVIVFNYRKGEWSIRKHANRIDVLGKYYRSGVEVILGGDSSGNLHEMNLGDSDNGAAINGYMLTKWHDGGLPDQEKDFRKLYIWVEASGDYAIDVGWSTDYGETEIPASVVIGTDGNDYTCVTNHEPSVVAGTDALDYYCIDEHTAATADKPITGANYANYWTATGTTGRGATWAADTIYVSNDDKKPITGGQYLSYWVPNNTIGAGSVWSASAGYSATEIAMQNYDTLAADANVSKFGVAIFGTDTFSVATMTRIFGFDLSNARGKAIRFMFRTTGANEPFTIRGYKAWFTYIPEFPA